MKILYLAAVRFPSEKANGIQIAKVCEAMSAAGADLTLVIPGRKTDIKENVFEYYGIREIFSIVEKRVPFYIRAGRIAFVLSQVLFGLRTLSLSRSVNVVISQDEWVLLWHLLRGRTCVYEVHNGRSNLAAHYVTTRSALLVANSQGTKSFYITEGIPAEKIMVFPNGVDVGRFRIPESKMEARRKLSLPIDKKLILYTGHLFDWKGADTLAKAARHLADDTLVVFVGGTGEDVKSFKARFAHDKVMILGHRPNNEMPLFLCAADVLVLPNNKIGESERFTSPMKLFEYLAAGKPIVASDLPSIREVLNDKNAFFFQPGDAVELAKTIQSVLQKPKEAEQKANTAKNDALQYSWNRSQLVSTLLRLTNS